MLAGLACHLFKGQVSARLASNSSSSAQSRTVSCSHFEDRILGSSARHLSLSVSPTVGSESGTSSVDVLGCFVEFAILLLLSLGRYPEFISECQNEISLVTLYVRVRSDSLSAYIRYSDDGDQHCLSSQT